MLNFYNNKVIAKPCHWVSPHSLDTTDLAQSINLISNNKKDPLACPAFTTSWRVKLILKSFSIKGRLQKFRNSGGTFCHQATTKIQGGWDPYPSYGQSSSSQHTTPWILSPSLESLTDLIRVQGLSGFTEPGHNLLPAMSEYHQCLLTAEWWSVGAHLIGSFGSYLSVNIKNYLHEDNKNGILRALKLNVLLFHMISCHYFAYLLYLL